MFFFSFVAGRQTSNPTHQRRQKSISVAAEPLATPFAKWNILAFFTRTTYRYLSHFLYNFFNTIFFECELMSILSLFLFFNSYRYDMLNCQWLLCWSWKLWSFDPETVISCEETEDEPGGLVRISGYPMFRQSKVLLVRISVSSWLIILEKHQLVTCIE